MVPQPDFSGWATRNNIRCTDGRTIRQDAFAHNDGGTVPLVWQHQHNDVSNVLGHAVLENREDGVYAHGFFNDSPQAQHAREMVKHGDIKSLSIYANQLVQKGGDVLGGKIRELSLVLSGANPGAYIENVNLSHSDAGADEVIIYSGAELTHAEGDEMPEEQGTIQDIVDTMDEEQQNALFYLIAQAREDGMNEALEGGAPEEAPEEEEYDPEEEEYLEQSDYDPNYLAHEGYPMNVFEDDVYEYGEPEPVLSHSDIEDIVEDAKRHGSLRDSFLAHAEAYGIENIDILFPEAKALTGPEFLKRQTEWVTKVLEGVHKTPFSRIKSIAADITEAEARAKGYITGTKKKDEVIKLLKRETTPTTIYKKQKLDRDNIVDITDLDVVQWLKGEMRLMLNEEIARAIVFGDGRDISSEDKVKEDNIRPIAKDVAPYTSTVTAVKTGNSVYEDLIDQIVRARAFYQGSGTPSLFTSTDVVTEFLLLKDNMGRRIYKDVSELKLALRVSDIIEVPASLLKPLGDVIGVIVNLNDYSLGSDRGGETTMFEDFDIDFNQQKYLIETRLSGCLTKPESAIVLKWGDKATLTRGFSDDGGNDFSDKKTENAGGTPAKPASGR